jgi:O-antigen ligase
VSLSEVKEAGDLLQYDVTTMRVVRESRGNLLMASAFLISIFILPLSYDPVGAPKQYLLSTLTLFSIGFILVFREFQFRELNNNFGKLISLFLILLIINVVINNYAISERIFGVSGRSTGLVTYALLTLFALMVYRFVQVNSVLFWLLVSKTVIEIYALVQYFGLDPFEFETFYSAPSSTLGNPNLVSGFVGFAAITSMRIWFQFRNWYGAILTLTALSLDIAVLLVSQSTQGFVALGASFFLFIFIFILKSWKIKKSPKLIVLVTFLIVFGLFLVIFSPFTRGYLLSSTLFSRFDYWRAGIRMLLSNPFFGVGLDGYGDHYRMHRDQSAINRFGEGQTADAAHNVFIDFFASGGFPLGIVYLILVFFGAIRVIRDVRASQGANLNLIMVLAIWAGFQIQSFVSINQIGIAIWGWTLIGVMAAVGKEQTEKVNLKLNKIKSSRRAKSLLGILIILLSWLPALSPLSRDAKFLALAKEADGLGLKEHVTDWPKDSSRVIFVAQGLSNAGLVEESLSVILVGNAHNPNNYKLWLMLSQNSKVTNLQKIRAFQEMSRLEPRVKPKV